MQRAALSRLLPYLLRPFHSQHTSTSSWAFKKSLYLISCGCLVTVGVLGDMLCQNHIHTACVNLGFFGPFHLFLRPPFPPFALRPGLLQKHPQVLGAFLLLLFLLSLPFLGSFAFCSLSIDLATVFTLAPPPLVLAEAAAAAIFALAPHPLVLAKAAAATVFTLGPPPLVLTQTTATAVLAHIPKSLVLADARAATVFTFAALTLVLANVAAAAVSAVAPNALVLANGAATAVLATAPPSLVLADATAAAVFALAPPPLVLTDAAAAAVFARAPLPVVLAQGGSLGGAGLLICRKMARYGCGLDRCGAAIGWADHTLLFALAALLVWPLAGCTFIQHSLRARRGLPKIRRQSLARHLLSILHVQAFFAVDAG